MAPSRTDQRGPSTSGTDEYWERIEKLRTMPRVKSFLWSCGHNILPTLERLKEKGISNLLFCSACGRYEDAHYAIMQCPVAKKFWKWCPYTDSSAGTNISLQSWLMNNSKKDEGSAAWICTFAWGVWWARNNRVFSGLVMEGSWLKDYTDLALRLVWDRDNKDAVPQDHAAERWQPPEASRVKLNTDAGLAQDGRWNLAFVCKSETGAVLFALEVVVDCNWRSIVIESGCLTLINKLNMGSAGRTRLSFLIADTRTLIEDREVVRWSHVPRRLLPGGP